MSENPILIKGLSLGYVFTFELSSDDKVSFTDNAILERFSSFVAESYVVGTGTFHRYIESSSDFLQAYRDEMYERRFKKTHLARRKTLLLQFPSQEIRGLAFRHSDLIPIESVSRLNCTTTLNEMGVGSLVFWIELDSKGEFTYDKLTSLRQADNLTTTVDWRLGPNKALRLRGVYSVEELARFVVISIFCSLYKRVNVSEIVSQLSLNASVPDIHDLVCKTCGSDVQVSSHLEFYPIYHIDYCNNPPGDNAALEQFVAKSKKQIRGLLTGDANWDKKSDDIISRFLKEHSFSTRESIRWFTDANGSLKIYSSELETPVLISKVLITFELEIMLTMKHFIYKIIGNLNYFSELSRSSLPLRSLARLRDREMRRLDEYYNLDLLQKDTTVTRLDKFKLMFRTEEMFQVALKKFEGLNLFMATEFQAASAKRQLALTIVFGMFGAGNLVYAVLRQGKETNSLSLNFPEQIFVTLGAMAIVAGVIILAFGRTKLK